MEEELHRYEEEQLEKEREHMEMQKKLTTLENVNKEEAFETRNILGEQRTWIRCEKH